MYETLTASLLFFALVIAWMVLPSSPKAPAERHAPTLEPSPA